ncbi:MAG: hypothetical protein HOW73_47450 [Polyangiaceae bacterium]|nr:hypothetical protein [Polyangiaceae bacterium]
MPFVAGCPEEPEPNPTPQEELEAPPAGEGFQFGTGEQPVKAGDEVQNCYFFKVSDLLEKGGLDPTKPLNLNHVQVFQTDGSHHMNIFRVRTVGEGEDALIPEQGPYKNVNGQGPCFKSPNWADWPLVANTQIDGTLDWQFPEGVANVLQPDEWIMLQSHYVNATTQDTPDGAGEVIINFWHLPDDKVEHEMGTLFATKQTIRVCQSNPEPEFSGGCQFKNPEPVTVVAANGHFHSRGKKFEMYNWDGQSPDKPASSEMFYESSAWDEPEMAIDNKLSTIPANGGVFYTCDFQWTQPEEAVGCEGLNAFDQTKYMTPEDQLDCCYTFGPIVEKNEHCNIFVYYYPKSDDISCN